MPGCANDTAHQVSEVYTEEHHTSQGGWVGQKKAILGLEPKWYIIITILYKYNRYNTRYNMQL